MSNYSDQGVIPTSRERLWKFLDLHARDDVIPLIHPEVVTQRIVSHSGSELVLARGIQFRGKVRPNTWKLTSEPPDHLRWEVVEAPEGPMMAGSWVSNRYRQVSGGTLVVTEGDIRVLGLPRIFQKRVARTVLNRIDDQDRSYLQDHP